MDNFYLIDKVSLVVNILLLIGAIIAAIFYKKSEESLLVRFMFLGLGTVFAGLSLNGIAYLFQIEIVSPYLKGTDIQYLVANYIYLIGLAICVVDICVFIYTRIIKNPVNK